MRCFIAIDLPNEIKSELIKLQKQIPEAKLKFVEKENLHLTLIFLGELDNSQINSLKFKLKEISFKKFKANLGKIGVFPSESFIRVVWVGLEPAEMLKNLHNKIFNQIKNIGNIDKKFESHITLARAKLINDKISFIKKLTLLNINPAEFTVNSFSLKKSTLTEKGPVYEEIAKFNLL